MSLFNVFVGGEGNFYRFEMQRQRIMAMSLIILLSASLWKI